jgi:hypothetical protein
MNRYVWTIDNKTVSETDKIMIKKGQNVRIIVVQRHNDAPPDAFARSFLPRIEWSG